jgi:hypothetical protein
LAHGSSTTRKPYSATYTAKWAASAAATKKTKAAAAAESTTSPATATATNTAVGTTTAKPTTTSDLYPVTSAWKTLAKSSTAAGHGEPAAPSGTATAAHSETEAWWAALQSEAAVAFAQANPKSLARRLMRRDISEMECDKAIKASPAKAAT